MEKNSQTWAAPTASVGIEDIIPFKELLALEHRPLLIKNGISWTFFGSRTLGSPDDKCRDQGHFTFSRNVVFEGQAVFNLK